MRAGSAALSSLAFSDRRGHSAGGALVIGTFLRFGLLLRLAFFLVAIYSLPLGGLPKEKEDYQQVG